MKDMAGVMEGFARHVDHTLRTHLVLAGPAVTGVADDPEAAEVHGDCLAGWRRLPHALRILRRSERLLRYPEERIRIGRNARERAKRELPGDTHLSRYPDVFAKLLA